MTTLWIDGKNIKTKSISAIDDLITLVETKIDFGEGDARKGTMLGDR